VSRQRSNEFLDDATGGIVPVGESLSRYATRFEVIDGFKSLQLPLLARRD